MPNAIDTLREWAGFDPAEPKIWAALAAVEALLQAADEESQPLMDERFRDRLLRHVLSQDEVEQFVEALEKSQARVAAAVRRVKGDT